ncbi:MAG TPA: lamin tail domain-containing protein, partial [Longimicrobium sp.]
MSLATLALPPSLRRAVGPLLALSVLGLAACADSGDSMVGPVPGGPGGPAGSLVVLYECTVDVEAGTQSCQTPRPAGASHDLIVGKPSVGFVTTGATASRLDPANEDTMSANVALTNLMMQPIGTLDGTTPAAAGSRIFFASGPTVTSVKVGTKTTETARVDNPSGIGNFTNPDGSYVKTGVPFYQYDGVIANGATSAPKAWRFVYSANTRSFNYSVLVSVPVQYEAGWVAIAAGTVTGANHEMLATVYSPMGAVLADSVIWTSSNPAVVTIDPITGLMTDVGPGSATVTATSKVNPLRKGTMAVSVAPTSLPQSVLLVYDCRAGTGGSGSLSCGASPMYGEPHVRLTESNLTVVGNVLQFDLTVQNLLTEAIGTPDGVMVDTAGVTVFVASISAGAGVENQDGSREMPSGSAAKPFYRYSQKLVQDEVSGSKPVQLNFAPGTTEVVFQLQVVAEVQPLLVINELMANPASVTNVDTDREWFEVYNAGRLPVQMEGMLIADSAASGRRPYHRIASSLVVQPGAYAVLGASSNTTLNGGVPVDYSFGGFLAFANSLDALKISRAYAEGDTLTLDRTQYASAAISAQNGVSRELKNPALDNSNLDGSNWANAAVTSVYGSGGRGT